MRSALRLLVRFAAIVLGYVAACLAASLFLNLLLIGDLAFPADGSEPVLFVSLAIGVPTAAAVVGGLAALPALVVIVVSEWLARRDWLFHALGGGGVGLAVALGNLSSAFSGRVGGAEEGLAARAPFGDPQATLLIVAAGMVGGLAYWTLAGRGAGAWRRGSDRV